MGTEFFLASEMTILPAITKGSLLAITTGSFRRMAASIEYIPSYPLIAQTTKSGTRYSNILSKPAIPLNFFFSAASSGWFKSSGCSKSSAKSSLTTQKADGVNIAICFFNSAVFW